MEVIKMISILAAIIAIPFLVIMEITKNYK